MLENAFKTFFLSIIQLNPLLIYFLVGLLTYLECAAFLGFLVPGETFLVLSGVIASQGVIEITNLVVLVVFTSFFGDVTGFVIGRRFGKSVFSFLSKRNLLPPSYVEATERFFQRYGAKTMVFARFVGFLRAAAPFLAGASRIRLASFLFYDFIGALAWTLVFSLGGYFLGEGFIIVEKYIGRGGVILFLGVLTLFFGRSIIKLTLRTIDSVKRRYLSELFLSLSFLAGLGLVFFLGREAREKDISFEMEILKSLIYLRNDFLTVMFAVFSALGSGYFVTFISFVSISVFAIRKRYRDALLFLAAVVSSNALGAILKITFRTERPDVPLISAPTEGFSFPSGHVVASSLIFWVIGWMVFRELKGILRYLSGVLFAIPVLVGLSRLYFGFHWPLDVFGGYAVSFIVFSFWIYFYEKKSLEKGKT